jgi:AcrR family transcriptional regulator
LFFHKDIFLGGKCTSFLFILPQKLLMEYHHSKIEPIFRYYLRHGFAHSMQEVADAVHLTKKTLFNRYVSKGNLELCLIDYWQIKSNERITDRMEFSNHSVERLMMFLFELQYCKNYETHFFQKTKELFLEKPKHTGPFIKQLDMIFSMGVEEELFHFDSDPKVFAYFFLFNALFLMLNDSLVYTDYLSFLFDPILTESGKIVFQDIDIEQVFRS